MTERPKNDSEKLWELQQLKNKDEDIALMVLVILQAEKMDNLAQLLDLKPDVFRLLYEEVMDMIRELPDDR